ncbi:OLC1v1015372C1 [Oldenlandia corymbosa var. corymbosa]|uniref:OLC1v1015372C1 n=1 Tax=Oldenlandia corymbosa var. corymbosa TaxID=529605 RepID=A0AAV1E6H6_OLDCO|nr:OLC1v1015372C1 [Oldenlandia corymbosa var. corymbosa]
MMWKMRSCGFGVPILVVFLAVVVPTVKSVWLDVPWEGVKCVSEDIRRSVVVLADYYVIPDEDDGGHHANFTPAISVKVTSPYGSNIHHEEKVTHGQFAFTASEDGDYVACFSVVGEHKGGKGATVGIDWKTGIAAKDWESVAKKEKIDGLELELSKLEGAVDAIRENLIYLKEREAEMRVVSERTNARVASFSIMSIAVCIMVSLVQVGYLKRYFQKRKLI